MKTQWKIMLVAGLLAGLSVGTCPAAEMVLDRQGGWKVVQSDEGNVATLFLVQTSEETRTRLASVELPTATVTNSFWDEYAGWDEATGRPVGAMVTRVDTVGAEFRFQAFVNDGQVYWEDRTDGVARFWRAPCRAPDEKTLLAEEATDEGGGQGVTAMVRPEGIQNAFARARREFDTQVVTYNANGGTFEDGIQVMSLDDYNIGSRYEFFYSFDFQFPTRLGYAFNGWYSAATGGTRVKESDLVTSSPARTLYAHWIPTSGPSLAEATDCDKLNFTSEGNVPWFGQTEASHDGTDAARSGQLRPSSPGGTSVLSTTVQGPGTISFHWKADASDGWSSVYDSWEGEDVMEFLVDGEPKASIAMRQTDWRQESFALGEGTHALKWKFEDGSTYDYGYYGLDCGFVDQIEWKPAQAVTFEANGGTCATRTAIYQPGNPYGSLPEATKAGYTFLGWWTAETGGTQVTAGSTVTADSARTLYAHWMAGTQTVTFQGNGGTPATQEETYTVDGKYASFPAVTRTGCSFAGWWTAANGGTQVTVGSTVTTDLARTLYAHWSLEVAFMGNGGTPATQSETYPLGETFGHFPSVTRAGCSFAGWWTAANGGTQVTAGNTVTTDSARTLYAHWSLEVAFKGNGGTPETQTGTYLLGETYGSLPAVTQTGHSFAGWWTAPSGGTPVAADSTVTMDSTLYAHWTANTYAVSLNRQGGTGGTASVTATYGNEMPAVDVPTRSGYVFGGYYSGKNGDGTQYYTASGKSAHAWDQETATTLYARWMDVNANLSITPTSRHFGTDGGFFTIVTEGSGTWEAAAGEEWITLNATSGQAGYPVAYEVAPTAQAESRTGLVYVSGQIHTVTQDGLGATISPTSTSFEKEGGTETIRVTAGDGVAWRAQTDSAWVVVLPENGTGPGQVTVTVAPLDAVAMRQGTLTVAGKTFSVTQYGRRMAIFPASAAFDHLPHTAAVAVEALDITQWSATPGASWISVEGENSGKGNGTVTLAIAENTSWKERTGTVSIGTETFTVTQQGTTALVFDISPAEATAAVAGGNGSIAVTATPDLLWSVASQSDWLTLKTASGAGNGTVAYAAAANPTLSPRSGIIVVTPGDSRVRAKTLAVTQPAAVATLSATGHVFAASGGSCNVSVSVAGIVQWSVENTIDWLTVAGEANRTGPGKVTLQAAANNTMSPRSGTVTIAGNAFQVTQRAPAAAISPDGFEFMSAGGSCTVTVSVPDAVQWEIGNEVGWLEVEGASSRTGPGTVTLRAAPNATVHPRGGTVSIASLPFQATQKAGRLEVGFEKKVFGLDGGSDLLPIRAESQVEWKAVVSDPTWITVFGADSGTGDGSVRYIVSQYVGDGVGRTGSIVVEDKVVRIVQAADGIAQGFPDVGDAADLSLVLESAADGRLANSIQSVEDYESFRAWMAEKGVDPTAVKESAHAWPSYVLGAATLFGEEPEIELGDVSVVRDGTGGMSVDVDVTVADGGRAVQVDAARVAKMFEATSDLRDWNGEAKLYPIATPTGSGDPTMQFNVVPDSCLPDGAFLRLVLKLPQSVTFAPIGSQVPTNRVMLSAIATSEGAVTFEVVSGPGQISGNVLSFTDEGTVVVRAVQVGDERWTAASATQTVTIAKLAQTIDFAAIGPQTPADCVTLSATATSGGTVTFEVMSGPGVIEGNMLTFTGEGTVEVRAVQSGDNRWLPATATQTVLVVNLYMVVDLSVESGDGATASVSYLGEEPQGGWGDEYKTTKLVLRKIEPGTFMMCGEYQTTLTKPYYMGVFEVTQKQWELVMGSNPSSHKGDMRPVERVSYDMIRGSSAGAGWPGSDAVDADSFLSKLGAKTGLEFNLPTEAQWEYACRAGTTSDYNNGGNSENDLKQLGRYQGNQSDGKGGYSYGHATVGSYLPNAWGLYDMHGNVLEWCLDGSGSLTGGVTNPVGSSSSSSRMFRGGCWHSYAFQCTSSFRDSCSPAYANLDAGFRLVSTKRKNEQAISFAPIGTHASADRVELSATATSGGQVTFEVMSGPGVVEGNMLSFTGAGTVVVRAVQAGDDLWRATSTTQAVEVVDDLKELYMVVDLSVGNGEDAMCPVTYLDGEPAGGWADEYKTTKLVMRRIEPGTFMMDGRYQTTLTKPYYVGVFEVTQKQWELVMGSNPSQYTGDMRPVENVSYDLIRGTGMGTNWPASDAVGATSFMGKLQAKTGLEFDLPTEALWEFSCRAGTTSSFNNGGNTEDDLKQLGRYSGNQSDGEGGHSEHTTVGSYLPNAWGLYDMHGNVREWCLDWYGNLSDGFAESGGPSSGMGRVLRGGSWNNGASHCTSSFRNFYNPSRTNDNSGFRLVRSLPNSSAEREEQTISFAPIGVQLATNCVVLSATATSGRMVTFEVVSGPGVVSGNVLTFTGDGTVEVQALQAGVVDRWLPASAMQTVIVEKAAQTIDFAPIGDPTWQNDHVELSATATSGGAVTFEVVSGPGKIDGIELTFTEPGTVVVRAAQAGDERWLPASATQTVAVVEKVAQTIDFAPIGAPLCQDHEVGVILSATATSGGAVTFEVMSGPGVVTGKVLTFTGPGTVVVRAVQVGDERWLPASETQTVVVESAGTWQTGTWTDDSWQAAEGNLIRGKMPCQVENSSNETDDDPSRLTNGSITSPDIDGYYEIESSASLTYCFDAPSVISEIRFFAAWRDSALNGVCISSIEVSSDGTDWTTLQNSCVIVPSSSAQRHYAFFLLAPDVEAQFVRINFGLDSWWWTGYAEIEVLGTMASE